MGAVSPSDVLAERLASADTADSIAAQMRASACVTFGEFIDLLRHETEPPPIDPSPEVAGDTTAEEVS